MINGITLFLGVGLIALSVYLLMNYKSTLAILCFIGGIAFGSFALLAVEVPAGHVGVRISFGVVDPNEMPSGLHFVVPVINHVELVDTRLRALRIEGYTSATREQQDLFINATLNYRVDPLLAAEIVRTIGPDFEAKVVMPRFLDIPKSVTDNYAATIVLNSRDEIRELATQLLRESLAPYGLIVENMALENFSYSIEYNAAIEAKQVEQQRIQTEQQVLEQRRIQAEQAIVKAQGEAQATIEAALGQAEANRLLAESISDQLIQWQAINKLNPNVQIMLVPTDGGFILDLKSMLAGPQPQ